MGFINFANHHCIIILVLLPYTTHKLQSLDIDIFHILSTKYSLELDEQMAGSGDLTYILKRLFFGIYKRTFDKSFTTEAIKHAFAKPRI
jgi:hypothetical protein